MRHEDESGEGVGKVGSCVRLPGMISYAFRAEGKNWHKKHMFHDLTKLQQR